jgi:hypothetical protein
MACSLQLYSANLIVPAGQTTATLLRVTGEAMQCPSGQVRVTSSITAAVGAVANADPVRGRFRVDIPITATPAPQCGDSVDLLLECVGSEAVCRLPVQGYLAPCCEFPTLFFDAEVAPNSLTPSVLRVSGVAYGCPTDEVIVSSSVTAASGAVTVNPLTGGFSANLAILTPMECGDAVTVTVECASGGVQCTGRTESGPVACIGCFRATVKVKPIVPCTGTPPKQTFTFDGTVAGIAPGTTTQLQWHYGDGQSSGPLPVTNPATGTVNSHLPLPPDKHDYAPGNYTATLGIYQSTECNVVPIDVHASCDDCPTVTLTPPTIDAACVGGTRHVKLHAQVVPAAGQTAVVQWAFGDTQVGPARVLTPGVALPAEPHDYTPPGPYTPTLNIILPVGCPPVSGPPITLNPCGCDLTVLDSDLVLTPGACNPDGTRTVTGTISIANPDPADRYLWQWTSAPVTGTGLTAALGGTTQTHDYAAGVTYTVKVTVRRGPDCQATATQTVIVPACTAPCPQLTGVTATVGACLAGTTTREVTLTAQTAGAIGQYVWTFGDGTPDATTTSPTITHAYAGGTFTATVTASPAGCPPTQVSTQPFTVPTCCPQVTGITSSAGACPASSATREMTLTAQTSGAGGQFVWTFGDGSSVTTSSATVTHSYGAGTFTATVTTSAPGCSPTQASTTFSVAACPSTGGGGGMPSPACSVWCVISGMLFIAIPISAFISTVAHCLVFGWNIGLQAAIIATAMGIFLAACGECCLWIFLLIGAGLGIVATLIASYWLGFPACWYAGLALLIGFIALGIGMAIDCKGKLTPTKPAPPPSPSPPAASSSSALSSESSRPAGLGDVIKQATGAVGIRPCAGCRERAERLNALVPFGTTREPGSASSPPSAT